MGENFIYSEEQMDFIIEMFNIGSGNAATAFSQLIQKNVDVKTPAVHFLPDIEKMPQEITAMSQRATGAIMKLVGDIMGNLLFIVTDEHRPVLVQMAEEAMYGQAGAVIAISRDREFGLSVISETANILAGAYLNAIFDFCGLRIYHTVPIIEQDTMNSLIGSLLVSSGKDARMIVLVETEFIIKARQIKVYLMFSTSEKYIGIFMDSISSAMKQ